MATLCIENVPEELLSSLRLNCESIIEKHHREQDRKTVYAKLLESDEAFFEQFGWSPIVRAATYTLDYPEQAITGPYNYCPKDDQRRHPVYMRGSGYGSAARGSKYWSKLVGRYLYHIRFTCINQQRKVEFSDELRRKLEKKMKQLGFAYPKNKAKDALFSSKHPGTHFTDYQWIDGKPYGNLTKNQLKSLGLLESFLPENSKENKKQRQQREAMGLARQYPI